MNDQLATSKTRKEGEINFDTNIYFSRSVKARLGI